MTSSTFWSKLATTLAGTATATTPVPTLFESSPERAPSDSRDLDLLHDKRQVKNGRLVTKQLLRRRWALLIVLIATASRFALDAAEARAMTAAEGGETFPIVEVRRYEIEDGSRQAFARYFEAWFPEAFRQLGAIVFGHFLEREDSARFTWLRGFSDMNARARINAEFYHGPLWKERRSVMNDLMVDSSQVLLLRPLRAGSGVPVLPPVDPLADGTAPRGLVVMQILRVKEWNGMELANRVEEIFRTYEVPGVREAGVLVTLDAVNNFPQLPVLEDGPYLVWLGIVEDRAGLESALRPAIEQALEAWRETRLLDGAPELVVMDPLARSRLRWIRDPEAGPA